MILPTRVVLSKSWSRVFSGDGLYAFGPFLRRKNLTVCRPLSGFAAVPHNPLFSRILRGLIHDIRNLRLRTATRIHGPFLADGTFIPGLRSGIELLMKLTVADFVVQKPEGEFSQVCER